MNEFNNVANQPKRKYSKHEVETVAGQKRFIESRLKHKSTRVGDIPKLNDCLSRLAFGIDLDQTQITFIKALYNEVQERSKKYNANKRKRASARMEEYRESLKRQNENANEVPWN